MNINITPEDVDSLVREALMKASFGKAVSEAITKSMSGYDSPVDKAVKAHVTTVAEALVREKFDAQIKEAVAAKIEAMVTTELIDKAVSTTMDKMVRAAQERY